LKKYLGLIILFFLATNLFALPRFAMMEEVSCGSCHSYQGGGAARSLYGKEYVAESLVMMDIALPWQQEESDFPLYVGLDTRYQMISKSDEDLRHFPMQLALYAGAEFGGFVAHAEVNRVLEEFRVTGGLRYEGLPLDTWISVGREMPALGWRLDDHTVFTRGGNLNPLGLTEEGMPFTPYLEPPNLVEIGASPLPGLELSVMIGTRFIDPVEMLDESAFNGLKASYTLSAGLISAQANYGLIREVDISVTSIAWGLTMNKLVYLGEYSTLENAVDLSQSNLAILNQLSYRLFNGFDIIARYEFFDPEQTLLTGAITRVSLGVELFPIPGIEIKLSYRQSQLEFPDIILDPEGQLLGQIHFYL